MFRSNQRIVRRTRTIHIRNRRTPGNGLAHNLLFKMVDATLMYITFSGTSPCDVPFRALDDIIHWEHSHKSSDCVSHSHSTCPTKKPFSVKVEDYISTGRCKRSQKRPSWNRRNLGHRTLHEKRNSQKIFEFSKKIDCILFFTIQPHTVAQLSPQKKKRYLRFYMKFFWLLLLTMLWMFGQRDGFLSWRKSNYSENYRPKTSNTAGHKRL